MNRKKLLISLIPMLVGIIVGVGVLLVDPNIGKNFGERLYSTSLRVESFYHAVARAAPSVVNIYVTNLNSDYTSPAVDLDDITASASGVIMSTNGIIVTNYHVVPSVNAPNKAVWAQTREGKMFQAFIVGYDRRTDIAVLKVEAEGLQPISLNKSYEPEVGDVVLAIGNPNNLGQTVTHGIISAIARSGSGLLGRDQMNIREGLQDLIQTDAPINSGNSGGALINTAGDLVGINTASFNGYQTYGIGFAVPAKMVMEVTSEIIRHGHVVRGYLGISDDGTTQLPNGRGLGVKVGYIDPEGPAFGLLFVGDIIETVNEQRITSLKSLIAIISQSKPGTELVFKIIRDGLETEVKVTLIEDRTSIDES
ncbi:MAG: trypsin-like peptidase domain-containing protein [Succinivibrio sp.]|nr:trypsin-like peptidase domain-containing protein [Succinivibrio sp.]